MKVRLIHVGSSYQMGLTNQEAQLALAYKKIPAINSLIVTGELEQYEGGFNLLKNNGIAYKTINGFDEHHDFLRLCREFSNIVSEFNPDIVTVNTNWQLAAAGMVNLFGKKNFKVVYTIHGFRHNSYFKSIFARYLIGSLLFICADLINAPTLYVKNKFSFLSKRIVTIPLGEDDVFFEHSEPPDFSSPFNFIFPGVFRSGKNQELIISAFSEYIKLSKNEQGMLYLPGEGELRPRAMQLAADLGIANRVVFPGQLNRKAMLDMYKTCQVAIIPSNDETFGHCIAEPLVMQRIVISRNVGLAPDFLINGKNGFLFDGKDDLVQRLLEINSMSEDALINVSESAHETGKSFRWDSIAKKHYNEMFKRIV